MKKVLSTVLAGALMASTLLPAATAMADDYEQVTYAFMTLNNIPSEEGLATVQDALNELTREKIGVEVTLKPIGLADYSQSVSRSLQGGEKIDVFQTVYNFANCVSMGMALDMTDLIDEYAPETKEIVGDKFLKATTVDGSLYGVPVYKGYSMFGNFYCRADIAEECGIDVSTIQSLEDITAVYEKVQEAHPEMTMIAPMNAGNLGITQIMEGIDYLSDSDTGAWGVLFGDDTTVQDLYSSELFMDTCKQIREWYEAGYVMKDAATTVSTVAELIGSGNYFSCFSAHGLPADEIAAQLSAMYGYPLAAAPISDPFITTTSINTVVTVIASNTEVPEASMKFLNLLYTDADVINTIIFGIEGRDYVLSEDGYAGYPEGEDPATVPYTCMMDNGVMGNIFIMHPLEGTTKAGLEFGLEQNEIAAVSPALGFTFDPSRVSSQYTAVANVTNQYLPGIICGAVDPETEIPKFVDALNAAGYQDILEAKQEQLNAWLEEN